MIIAPGNFLTANAALQKEPVFIITIDTYSRVFTNKATGVTGQYDWLESIDDHNKQISELDGGSNVSDLTFTVSDIAGGITADFPGFVFEGKAVTLTTGFVGMAQTDFALLFTGVIDTVASANGNNSYLFTCIEATAQVLSRVIYGVADDSQPTSSKHIRTLNGHPLDIFLAALTTELGLLSTQINEAKITAIRDSLFAGMQFFFEIDSPPVAKDFLEQQILKPLGAYMWTNSAGQIDVNFFYANSPLVSLALTDDNIVYTPLANQTDLINTISFRFDKSGGNSGSTFLAESVQEFAPSITKYGIYGSAIIESDGMRSGLQGFFLAALTATIIFLRYGLKNLKFDEVELLWSACILEPGDMVTMTSAFVPDRVAGVMGITNHLFQVFDRTWDFTNGIVKVRLMDASYINVIGHSLITPNAEGDFTVVSSADRTGYMFLANNSDQYSDGTAGNTLT
jgi:hypothetical protein